MQHLACTPALLLQRVGQCCPVTSEQVPGNGSTETLCYVAALQYQQITLEQVVAVAFLQH